MSWKEEIYRAFFVTFGMFEIITNLSYLVLKNGLDRAIRQHGELPKDVSKKQIRTKIICMLIFGSIFFVIGLYSFINKLVDYITYLCILISFSIYAIIEGCYYRYWKTMGVCSFFNVTIYICYTLIE